MKIIIRVVLIKSVKKGNRLIILITRIIPVNNKTLLFLMNG